MIRNAIFRQKIFAAFELVLAKLMLQKKIKREKDFRLKYLHTQTHSHLKKEREMGKTWKQSYKINIASKNAQIRLKLNTIHYFNFN